jgi:hypothetical protein
MPQKSAQLRWKLRWPGGDVEGHEHPTLTVQLWPKIRWRHHNPGLRVPHSSWSAHSLQVITWKKWVQVRGQFRGDELHAFTFLFVWFSMRQLIERPRKRDPQMVYSISYCCLPANRRVARSYHYQYLWEHVRGARDTGWVSFRGVST